MAEFDNIITELHEATSKHVATGQTSVAALCEMLRVNNLDLIIKAQQVF